MKLLIKILVVYHTSSYYVSLHWYESYFRYVKRLLLSSRHLIASVPTDFEQLQDSKESKESKKLAHTVASLKSTKEISHPAGFEQDAYSLEYNYAYFSCTRVCIRMHSTLE